ncbi:MAG: phosphotransferase [Kineosporiaceae bacterium]
MRTGPDEAHRRMLADLLDAPPGSVVALGAGLDHQAFAVGDELIARFVVGPDAEVTESVTREAEVLRVVEGRLPVATPHVVDARPELGLLVTSRIQGSSLLGRDMPTPATADSIADVLVALHTIDVAEVASVVEHDDHPLTAYAEEGHEHLVVAGPRMPATSRRAAEAALGRVPEDAPSAVFVHDDFGAEHLFVDDRGALTGVIDWADAAVADPARDLARGLRDFGPAVHSRVVARYPAMGDPDTRARTWFLARCMALEDLAYGITEGRQAYAEAALRSLTWLLPDRP